ncbi:STRUCTURAL ELEMENTS; Cell Exterior; surface polysaccharides/antigens [hydrothermal vent metagenome]|uniref:STRUCTURAL ELEMENTS Cell Exterior surface polysaccharides/antigens n=1 Tax=hydrothermal vent metagenome TaxID=652676 RepID=A0A3B0XLU8_9ZZZZ
MKNAVPRLLSLNSYNYRRGGSDAVFIDHDKLFSDAGWNTCVFTMHHPENRPSSYSKYFTNELEFGEAYSIWQKLHMAGKVIYSLEARNKLAKLIDQFPPEIAHAHCIYHHLSPSVLSLLRSKGIPTVLTAHDLKLACPAYKMLNNNGICEKCKNGNLLHLVKNRCIHGSLATSTLVAIESSLHKTFKLYKNNLNKVVTPSIFFHDKLVEWGWDSNQLAYIPNFINCDNYSPQYEPGNYFLYFGRLAPEKGTDTLIKAALKAGVKLRIAGTGPYESELRALVPENNDNIEFLGFCSGDKLWTLIREARAIVLPSQWYENAPISILEAYASGKPVIGADIGGIPEMLKEGETGFLFESGNTQDLTEKLKLISNIPTKEIINMGKLARDYVSSTFTSERYYSDMTALYKSLGADISITKTDNIKK